MYTTYIQQGVYHHTIKIIIFRPWDPVVHGIPWETQRIAPPTWWKASEKRCTEASFSVVWNSATWPFFVGNELTLMQKGCIFRLIDRFVKSYALLISDLLIFDIWSCCWISATWTTRLGLPSMWFTSSESYADLSLWWGHLKACATKGNCMQPAMWLGDTRGCSGFITQKGMSLGGRHSKHDFSSLVLLDTAGSFFKNQDSCCFWTCLVW